MSKLKNVSAISTYEIDKSFDSEKFIKLRVRVAHDGINPNGSNFDLSDMNKAKDSIVNIPILAYCYFDEDNNPQFDVHAMHIEKDKVKEGEYRLIYDEIPIGLVPETCNYEIKEFNGRNYVYVDAFVWKNYSNYMQDIVERDKDINISMEILVDSYKFNKELNCYDITDYRYTGITLLGNDIGTGMLDAKATTSTFDLDAKKEKTVILMQELKDELAFYNNKNLGKEDEILTDKIEETVVETTEEFTEVVEPIVDAVNEEVIETPEVEEVIEEVVEETEVIEVAEEVIEVVEEFVETPIIETVEKTEFEKLQLEFDEYKLNYSIPNSEVERLQAFEQKTISDKYEADVSEVFTKFEKDLKSISEFESLKSNYEGLTVDIIEEKCFAFLGKKNANFSAKPKETVIKIPFESKTEDETDDGYGGLLAKKYNQ